MNIRLSSMVLAATLGLAMAGGNIATAEAKGGHGHGHGHKFSMGHGHKYGHFKRHKRFHIPYGWSQGRKVGWRGRHTPPGHWRW